MVPGRPNTISPCSFNRLPWAGGFELPGLYCSQARTRYFKATETEQNIYPILNRLMSDMEPLSMHTGNVGVRCGGWREI